MFSIWIKAEGQSSMSNHGFNIASVSLCFLFTSNDSDRLSELLNFKEWPVIQDWAGCPSIEQEFNFESTFFLAVSGGKVEGVHMKTWIEVFFFLWSQRLEILKGRKRDKVFTTSCPWLSIFWTKLGVGRLLLCGRFLLYWVSKFSGLALKLNWVWWQLLGPSVQELLDLSWWYCLSKFECLFLSKLQSVCG